MPVEYLQNCLILQATKNAQQIFQVEIAEVILYDHQNIKLEFNNTLKFKNLENKEHFLKS